jgi:hypothetical protein
MFFTEPVALIRGCLSEAEKPESDEICAVIVDTFEDGDFPVVRHVFYGKTEADARAVMEAHKGSDKFFAGCAKGKMGNIKCRNSKVTVKKVKKSEL